MRIKVLSWNIWLDGDLDTVIDFVRESDADIIGMQEVIPERQPNVLESLAALGYKNVFSSVMKSRRRGLQIGNAILSKYPIQKSVEHVLSETERRTALQADIIIENTTLYVFNTHLLHTHQKQSDTQDLQVANLLKLLSREKTIVMGDFNATPESSVIQRMESVLNNCDPNGTPTWSTDPRGCKTCAPQAIDTRLDYIFASKDLKTNSPAVLASNASDHLPLSVTIE